MQNAAVTCHTVLRTTCPSCLLNDKSLLSAIRVSQEQFNSFDSLPHHFSVGLTSHSACHRMQCCRRRRCCHRRQVMCIKLKRADDNPSGSLNYLPSEYTQSGWVWVCTSCSVQPSVRPNCQLRREYSDLPREMVDAKLLQCVLLKYTIYLFVSLQRPMHRCVYAYLLVMALFLPNGEAEAPVAALCYLMPAFQFKSHLYPLRDAISRLDKYFMHRNLHCHDILTNKRPATVHFLVVPPCDFSADIFSFLFLFVRSFVCFDRQDKHSIVDSLFEFHANDARTQKAFRNFAEHRTNNLAIIFMAEVHFSVFLSLRIVLTETSINNDGCWAEPSC